MDNKSEVREFLTTRRARISPDAAGLATGPNRRVAGLRRSEVAMLADVSVEYYSRLERGDLGGVSETVLASVARALQLDDAERSHLLDLARTANGSPLTQRRRPQKHWTIRPSLRLALDSIPTGPAFVRNGRLDVLAENAMYRALYSPLYDRPERPINLARFTFLQEEDSRDFYTDWDLSADITVQILRTEAGRDPHDRNLQDLIGELSTRSLDFRTRWGKHDVRRHSTGEKFFHHPIVGDMHLVYEAMDLMEDPGLNFLVYNALPGSVSADSLTMLASWAATREVTTAAQSRSAEDIPQDQGADVIPRD